jgi:hypothetical protein
VAKTVFDPGEAGTCEAFPLKAPDVVKSISNNAAWAVPAVVSKLNEAASATASLDFLKKVFMFFHLI